MLEVIVGQFRKSFVVTCVYFFVVVKTRPSNHHHNEPYSLISKYVIFPKMSLCSENGFSEQHVQFYFFLVGGILQQ